MQRPDLPALGLIPDALDELGAQACEDLDRGRGNVIPIQGEEIRPSGLASIDSALTDKSIESHQHASLGAAPSQARDVTPSQRSRGAREDLQDVPVESRAHRGLRSPQVHVEQHIAHLSEITLKWAGSCDLR